MQTVFLLLALLTPDPAPTTKDAAKALTALDQIHAADEQIERACVKAWKARENLPAKPLPHLSDEMNKEIAFYRAYVTRACPDGGR